MSISPLTNATPSNPSVSSEAPDGAVFMANAAQNRLCEQLVTEAVGAVASMEGRIQRLRRMTPEQARQELTRRNSNDPNDNRTVKQVMDDILRTAERKIRAAATACEHHPDREGIMEDLEKLGPKIGNARDDLSDLMQIKNSNEFMEKMQSFAKGFVEILVLFRNVQRAVTP